MLKNFFKFFYFNNSRTPPHIFTPPREAPAKSLCERSYLMKIPCICSRTKVPPSSVRAAGTDRPPGRHISHASREGCAGQSLP